MNTYQSNLLEKLQKRSLRAIYGHKLTYGELLDASKLSNRREAAFCKFTSNTIKDPKYAHWFPNKPSVRCTRTAKKCLEEHCVGNRLYKFKAQFTLCVAISITPV